MKIALMGQDIPALLPSLLADLFFAGRADAEAALQEKNDAMRDLMARYGAAVTRKAGRGRVSVTPDRDAALAGADAVIYAGDPMAASRFRMDREALSGLTEDDPGLSDQARVLGGIGGLMHTLRQAEQILDLCEAMRRDCPDTLVITLGSPVARTAALFARQGFRCFGLTQGWRTGPGGLAWLCRELGVKPEDTEAQAAGLPDFTFLKADWSGVNGAYLLTLFVAYAPVAFVVFAEHLADHKNLSSIVGVNLLEEPGLTRTLLGDGIGSFVGAFFGGCPNTTYGESIATVAITRNASTISIWGAAIACILFSLITPLVAFLETIPNCVMGGVCIALYGFIAASGLKMLQPVDLNKNRNLFVASVIFIVGVGGMTVNFGRVEIRTVACALILGILTNVMLSKEKDEA